MSVATADDVLAGLDPEQRAVATAIDGPVVVLAGAGTGKTRAITHRMAYAVRTGAHDPRRSLAVTFTARAAGEMRDRLRTLGVEGLQARTFHAAALRQLRFFWPRVIGGPPPELLVSKARFVAEAAARCGVSTAPATVRDLAAEIEWAKVTQTPAAEYAAAVERAQREPPEGVPATELSRVYAAYDELKSRRGYHDFEDALLLLVGILDSRPDVADEVRAAYRWFTVDEYQDVSPLQQRLLDLWLGERDDLCVVGDAAQTIYSFTGATPAYLMDFAHRYADATVVRLVRSYRCTPQVVAVANAVLAAARGPLAAQRLTLQAQRPAGPVPRLVAYDDEVAEADGVAAAIGGLITSGVPAREIAVLFRVNAASEAYEQALAAAGVSYLVRGGERFFDRAEVREAVTRLRGAAAAAGPAAAAGLNGLGEGTEATHRMRPAEAHDLPAAVREVLAAMAWSAAPPAGRGAGRERWESLASLVTLAEDLVAAGRVRDLRGLVDELDRRQTLQHAPMADGVTLASLHSAKGLEWEAVFLVGLTEGMLPIVHADTPERVEEERRLFYVGITRARTHLSLSWAKARTPGGRGGRNRSRFLDDAFGRAPVWTPGETVPATVRSGPRRSRSERGRKPPGRCRVCGKALVTGPESTVGRCQTCPAGYDEALLERLRAWRLEEARRRVVPAYVIFTDATLLAIAERTPDNEAALASITGVGPAKLARYAPCVLALVLGVRVPAPVDPPATDGMEWKP